MAKKTVQQSAGRLVIEVFRFHRANDQQHAITIDKFKDVPLSSDMIGYTFGNLIQEGVIVKTNDNRYYFDQDAWKNIERKVNRVYWFMLITPFVFLALFLLITNWQSIVSWFN